MVALSTLLLVCLVGSSTVQGSKEVTLTCGSGPVDDVARVILGPPGKQGLAGLKGEVGEKGEKGRNDDSSEVIGRLEGKIWRLKNQLIQSQREQLAEEIERKRNGNQILQIQEQAAELAEKLSNLQDKFAELKNNISVIKTASTLQAQAPDPSSASPPRDCQDVYAAGNTSNGVYNIAINGNSLPVYCDMETVAKGWTVFQKHRNDELDFNRNWPMYENGFGNLDDDFWLGLDNIYHLTRNRSCKLHVDVWDSRRNHQYARYSGFSIEDESANYRLHVSGYTGTAGDGLDASQNMQFSTKDRDHDRYHRNCAAAWKGGWWFNRCAHSCANCRGGTFWRHATNGFSTMKFSCE